MLSYIYIKNSLAKQRWHILIIMKDLILINSRLLNNFWAKVIEMVNYFQNRLSTKNMNHKEVIFKKF